jgi:GNAT superfamily N-acetyltransferase
MSAEGSMIVVDVSEGNIEDLCRLCVPREREDDTGFAKGMELKKAWVSGMLRRWGSVAKVAYLENTPAGLIQYVPVPDEKVVRILCIFVPHEEHWRKGIGKSLLTSLIEDMRSPKEWLGGEPPSALVTRPFPGEKPGQYPAKSFFRDMGFKQVEGDPGLLCYPLRRGFVYRPVERRGPEYVPQEDDKGKVVVIYGPSFCPWSYVFLERSVKEIKEAIPGVCVRWISSLEEPAEAEKRGIPEGIIVNARIIGTFLLNDREAFLKEVFSALGEN